MPLSLCLQVESRSGSLLTLTAAPAGNSRVVLVPASDGWSTRPTPVLCSCLVPSIVWGLKLNQHFRGPSPNLYIIDRTLLGLKGPGKRSKKKYFGQEVLASCSQKPITLWVIGFLLNIKRFYIPKLRCLILRSGLRKRLDRSPTAPPLLVPVI